MRDRGETALRLLSRDTLVRLGCTLCMAVIVAVLLWIVLDVARRGASSVDWDFLTGTPERAGRAGGIAPILLSTFAVMAVCMVVTVPLGLAAALGVSEFLSGSVRTAAAVRLGLDVLAGTPSIAFGLFGHAFFGVLLGFKVSVLSGGLTLACMTLPLFVRMSEHALRSVTPETRGAIQSLSLSRSASVFRVLIPASLQGLASAGALSLARALAETAAVLFTSGYVARTPQSVFDPGRVLSVHIYDLSMNVAGGDSRAYATALVLIVVLCGVAVLPMVPRLLTRGTLAPWRGRRT